MDNHNPYEKQILDGIICIHNSRDHYKRCDEESEIALTRMSIKLDDNEKEIADLKAENEKLRKSKGWVSVKDKSILSDYPVVTLVEMSDGDFEYHLICIDGSNGEIFDGEGELHDCWSIEDYTYWMPLPKLPEKE